MKLRFFILIIIGLNFSLKAQEIISQNDISSSEELSDLGWDKINLRDYENAVTDFTKSIKIYDGNTEAFVGRAHAYHRLKKYKEAEIDIKKALKISANESDINYLAGNIFIKLEKYEDAISFYTKALEFNERSEVQIDIYNCHFNRGNAYLFSEKYSLAIEDYSITLSSKVTFANAYHNRGIAYRHLEKKQDACKDFVAAVHYGSDKTEFYVKQYCKGINIKEIEYSETKENSLEKEESLNKIDFPLLLKDTLFYNSQWELCNSENYYYYRIGIVNTKDLFFVGGFRDYYRSDTLLLEGYYNEQGQKNGKFLRYYPNGQLYSTGTFEKNKMLGIWEFYYENGHLKERVKFNIDGFSILDSSNEDLSEGVVNGTGIWTKYFLVANGENMVLKAKFENEKRIGKWTFKSEKNQLVLTESYKNGNFQSGKVYKNRRIGENINETQIKKGLFYTVSYGNIEGFNYSRDTYRHHYPYLIQIPEAHSKLLTNKEIYNIIGKNLRDRTSNEKFDVVEEQPSPPGGMGAFYKFIGNNLKYPNLARRMGIEGRVFVQFVVETDGSLLNIKAIKGIGAGCDEEAERVIGLSRNWAPGKQHGAPVKVRMILPITFKLGR